MASVYNFIATALKFRKAKKIPIHHATVCAVQVRKSHVGFIVSTLLRSLHSIYSCEEFIFIHWLIRILNSSRQGGRCWMSVHKYRSLNAAPWRPLLAKVIVIYLSTVPVCCRVNQCGCDPAECNKYYYYFLKYYLIFLLSTTLCSLMTWRSCCAIDDGSAWWSVSSRLDKVVI